jgi:alkylation response protein AidB-like acyl-CoA dehydrogenase
MANDLLSWAAMPAMLGGDGYLKDFPIERYPRDMRVRQDLGRHQGDHARHRRPLRH